MVEFAFTSVVRDKLINYTNYTTALDSNSATVTCIDIHVFALFLLKNPTYKFIKNVFILENYFIKESQNILALYGKLYENAQVFTKKGETYLYNKVNNQHYINFCNCLINNDEYYYDKSIQQNFINNNQLFLNKIHNNSNDIYLFNIKYNNVIYNNVLLEGYQLYDEFDDKKGNICTNIDFKLNLSKFGDLGIFNKSLVYKFPKESYNKYYKYHNLIIKQDTDKNYYLMEFLKEDGFFKCEYHNDFKHYIFKEISFDIGRDNADKVYFKDAEGCYTLYEITNLQEGEYIEIDSTIPYKIYDRGDKFYVLPLDKLYKKSDNTKSIYESNDEPIIQHIEYTYLNTTLKFTKDGKYVGDIDLKRQLSEMYFLPEDFYKNKLPQSSYLFYGSPEGYVSGDLLFLSKENHSFNINDYLESKSDIDFLRNIIQYLPYVEYSNETYILKSERGVHSVQFKGEYIIINDIEYGNSDNPLEKFMYILKDFINFKSINIKYIKHRLIYWCLNYSYTKCVYNLYNLIENIIIRDIDSLKEDSNYNFLDTYIDIF